MLIFGLNQIVLGQGVLATLQIKIDAASIKGFRTIGMTNPVSSSPDAQPVLSSATTGTIKVL